MSSFPPIVPNVVPYVAPSGTNNELNDTALWRFLQTLVVGVTGMIDTMVRPRWQVAPPNQPGPVTVDWCAIGVIEADHDMYAAVLHTPGTDTVYRNQIIDVLASFYGANADANSKLLVNGFSIAQNREAMQLNGFGLVDVEENILTVPALIKEQWMMGFDVRFRMRRQMQYAYPVPDIAEVSGTIKAQEQTKELTTTFVSGE